MATGAITATKATTVLPSDPSTDDYWDLAFEHCKTRLPPKELARVIQISNYDQLKTAIDDLRHKTRQKSTMRMFNRLEPFLQNLQSFQGVIGAAIQSNPSIAALVWGGIKMVLEVNVKRLMLGENSFNYLSGIKLSLRLTNAFEKIASGMCRINQILPRVESYHNLLPLTPELNQAIVNVYEAIVEFCFETIKILRKHPMRLCVLRHD